MEENPSALSLCNIALSKLGESPIPAIDANGSPAARLCYMHYHPARREVLCAARWTFATKLALLKSVEQTASEDYVTHALRHPLPSDCLRVLDVAAPQWALQERAIYASVTPLKIRYIFNCEDVASFDPLFVDALATRIAEKLCIPLTASSTAREALAKEFHKIIMPLATSVNAMQSHSNDTHPLYRLWKDSCCCHDEDE